MLFQQPWLEQHAGHRKRGLQVLQAQGQWAQAWTSYIEQQEGISYQF